MVFTLNAVFSQPMAGFDYLPLARRRRAVTPEGLDVARTGRRDPSARAASWHRQFPGPLGFGSCEQRLSRPTMCVEPEPSRKRSGRAKARRVASRFASRMGFSRGPIGGLIEIDQGAVGTSEPDQRGGPSEIRLGVFGVVVDREGPIAQGRVIFCRAAIKAKARGIRTELEAPRTNGAVEIDERGRRVPGLGFENTAELEQARIARCECECRLDIRQGSLPITGPSANSGANDVGVRRVRSQRDRVARFGFGGRVIQGAQNARRECDGTAQRGCSERFALGAGFESFFGLAKIGRSSAGPPPGRTVRSSGRLSHKRSSMRRRASRVRSQSRSRLGLGLRR